MRDHRLAADSDRNASNRSEQDGDRVVGRTTLVETAMRGVAGEAVALPYADVIQRSFGRHDIRSVRAHIGGSSAEAAHALGADAYAVGDSIAFAAPPDLRLAAHEAAHVIQQRRGVRLFGGIGAAGDEYERHADAIADRVVQGMSAESLLDEIGGAGPTHMAVQRDERRTLGERAQQIVHDTTGALHDIGRFLPSLSVGASRKLELAVLAPIDIRGFQILIGGKLTLESARSEEGYEVTVTPRLTLGVRDRGRTASGVAFTEGRIGARGATRDAVGGLIEVALDHAVRACGRALPPFVSAALVLHPLGPIVGVADVIVRLYNYHETGQLTSQIWPWLADVLFDPARIAETRAGMGDGEYAETRDRVAVEGRYRPTRAGVEVAHERRWRVDDEHDFENETYEVTFAVEGIRTKVRYQKPAADPAAFAGECTIDMSLGTQNVALAILTTAMVRQVLVSAFEAIRRPDLVLVGRAIETLIVTAAQSKLRRHGAENDTAQIGMSVALPFDGSPITVAFKQGSIIDGMIEGNGVSLTNGRTLGTVTIPGITVPSHDSTGTPRDGIGRERATTSGRTRPHR